MQWDLFTVRKLLYTVSYIIVCLFLLEGAVRMRAWYRYGTTRTVQKQISTYDQELGFPVPKPGTLVQGNMINIKINSLGFRGKELAIEKTPATIRVVALGGSTTFCSEVSRNEATWPHRLQELLQARYPGFKIEVINAGFPGYTIAISEKNFRHRVLPLKPDIVILYHAYNDMVKDSQYLAQQQGLDPIHTGKWKRLFEFLRSHSMLLTLVDMNFFSRVEAGKNRLTVLPHEMPARFIQHMDGIHKLCQQHHCRLVLAAFLKKFRRNQSPESQRRHASLALHQMPFMSLETLYQGFDLYNRAIRDYASKYSLPFVSDRGSIPGDDEHFFDSIHFRDKGANKMAHRFFEVFVRENIIEQIGETRSAR